MKKIFSTQIMGGGKFTPYPGSRSQPLGPVVCTGVVHGVRNRRRPRTGSGKKHHAQGFEHPRFDGDAADRGAERLHLLLQHQGYSARPERHPFGREQGHPRRTRRTVPQHQRQLFDRQQEHHPLSPRGRAAAAGQPDHRQDRR